jgi:hypothetical protein
MSRLDRHVSHVQNKLALRKFVHALAWTAFTAAGAAAVLVFTWREATYRHLPSAQWWMIGAGLVVAGCAFYALIRRPGPDEAAIAIDQELRLDEKFSTALKMRRSNDAFAKAVVLDAETTANNVHVRNSFPIAFPRIGLWAMLLVVLAFCLGIWVPARSVPVSQNPADPKTPPPFVAAVREAERVLAIADTMPPHVQQDPKILEKTTALRELVRNQKFDDASRISRKAQEVLQDVQQGLADEAAKLGEKIREQEKTFSESFGDPTDYKSDEVKQVDKDLASNKFDKAVDDLGKMTKKFESMTKEEKEKVAEDVKALAKKLEKAAEDPKVQEQIKDKLQQMGVSQQQAQQMAQQMQQAAQGNKQAQQQVAQQVQQMQQQMQAQAQQLQKQAAAGNQQAQQQLAQLQQQQQAIQQAVQGMQGQANAQAQAQQMSQAAQQMAQAMQQQAQAGKQGQQGQQGQSQSGQQQMAQAQAQMQQAMQGMQAGQADAQQVAAAQAAAMKQAGQGGKEGKDGKGGQGQGGEGEGAQAQPVPGDQGKGGEWAAGDPNQNQGGNGPGGPGIANGGQTRAKAAAGFDIKSEHDIGEENKNGKILANTLIKDNQPKRGEAKLGLAQVTESVQKQASDEVDEDHVSGASRKAAEDYFRTMNRDAKK